VLLGEFAAPAPTPVPLLAGEGCPEAPTKLVRGDVLGLDAPPFDQFEDDDVWLCDWPPLLRNRTASIPSAKALPANTIGCRRANASTSVTISLVFRRFR
jgi:hypothetical protein